jgi:hypothetical protein
MQNNGLVGVLEMFQGYEVLKDAYGCEHRLALLLHFIGRCFPCSWIDLHGSDLVVCSMPLFNCT